jgi:hypothetical protein
MVFGYTALKQPFFGRGVRVMVARHASRLRDATVGAGARFSASLEAGVVGWAEVPKDEKSPNSRFATIMMPRTVVPRARGGLKKVFMTTLRGQL